MTDAIEARRAANREVVLAADQEFERARNRYLDILERQLPVGCCVRVWFSNGNEYAVDAGVLWIHRHDPGCVEIRNNATGKRRHFHVRCNRWERL